MSTIYNNAAVTALGLAAIAKQTSDNSVVQFTRFKIGNGIYTDEEKTVEALRGATALKSEKNTFPISSKRIATDNVTVVLKLMITNYDPDDPETSIVSEDYYVNEIGLFAKVDGGAEFLFSIAVCTGATGNALAAFDGTNPMQIIQEYNAKTDNSENVTVVISGAYALAVDVDDHEDRISTLEEIGAMAINNFFYAGIEDEAGNVIGDDDGKDILGDWKYKIQ